MLAQTTHQGVELPEGKTVADVVAEVILSRALAGDFRMMVELLNRVEGKVPSRPAPAHSQGEITIVWEDTEEAIRRVYGP